MLVAIAPDTRNRVTVEITLGLLVLILLYRLVVVSYHSYADLEKKVAEISEQLVDKMEHQTLADELTVQHERGKALIKPGVFRTTDQHVGRRYRSVGQRYR